MTVLAGYIDDRGDAALACDTGSTGCVSYEVATKIARVGHALVGSTGAALWTRFLAAAAPVDAPADVERLADDWLSWARARGHGSVEQGAFTLGATLLVLLRGCSSTDIPHTLWLVDGLGAVERPTVPYLATGSGGDVAMGALHAAARLRLPATDAVRGAVAAALDHGPGCFGRVVVHEIWPPT